MKKTVLIADRHYVWIKGLTHILKTISQDILIDYVRHKEELTRKISQNDYDLLILDIDFQDNIYGSAREFKEQSPSLKIMIFSENKEELALSYLYEGVEAYLSKSEGINEIQEAIHSVFMQGYYYSQELLYKFIKSRENKKNITKSSFFLSRREKVIYNHLLQGKGILEISNLLRIHQSTVSTHKRRIFNKLQVKNLSDLIHFHNRIGSSMINNNISLE
ncbi:response regulator transcription factor [Chryseobacterium potabilaquae]|uniref:Response regulator UvrY n=1 Tax=Chryseobacterium potabilaquae TaxID=2675057 RepID=A0A6N4XBE2_9FLAO|nr:response regulator transcription factor [Chryseobacterium potabilaquae]CAA7197064.1 Response regulator UvrY [Chryseobacterium potabilaquae]